MRDVMVPSKRARVPSFADKHPDYPEKGMDEVHVNKFLELCGFCRKNLRHDKDVFMYGYFGAFCSKGCRAKQMACDIFTEKSREIVKAKKGRTCEGIKPKDSSKDEPLDNLEKSSSPRFYI